MFNATLICDYKVFFALKLEHNTQNYVKIRNNE